MVVPWAVSGANLDLILRLGLTALWLAVALGPAVGRGQDATVSLLERQLKGARDPRLRAQTALLLGRTASEDAVRPLCQLLREPESIVRAAAASALGDLRLAAARRCLEAATAEADAVVRGAVERALAYPHLAPETLYVVLEAAPAVAGGGAAPELLSLVAQVLREEVIALGAVIAPADEERKLAEALTKQRRLRGFRLRYQLHGQAPGTGLRVELLVMTYPGQSIKGSWSVRASGGKPQSLVRAMVKRVVADAAGDLDWKR